jgi:hypothetical protein
MVHKKEKRKKKKRIAIETLGLFFWILPMVKQEQPPS